MGRTHKAEQTFARAASHLGFAPKEHFFEAMKAILAVQRDHGNREVPSGYPQSASSARVFAASFPSAHRCARRRG